MLFEAANELVDRVHIGIGAHAFEIRLRANHASRALGVVFLFSIHVDG